MFTIGVFTMTVSRERYTEPPRAKLDRQSERAAPTRTHTGVEHLHTYEELDLVVFVSFSGVE